MLNESQRCPPLLFLIFNRPDLTARVFDRIRGARPAQLFVAADGPRSERPDEPMLCSEARRIITEGVDWDCEVKTLFRDQNLGCKIAVSSAITWFFENVEEGIILEDDCHPDPTFFGFCVELLQHYKNDARVMMISGSNLQAYHTTNESYHFSIYPLIWGWACWKRAWLYYDGELKNWDRSTWKTWLDKYLVSPDSASYWANIFDAVAAGSMNTWDQQWVYTCWQQHGLSINPNVNLVTNIGFGLSATHTLDPEAPLADRPTVPIALPLQHPKFMIRDYAGDDYLAEQYFQSQPITSDRLGIRESLREAIRALKAVLKKANVIPE